jgi:hypothetical protein
MKNAINEQNTTAKGKPSTACHRQNLGCLTAFFGHIPKKAVFWVFFRFLSAFCGILSWFFFVKDCQT